MSDEDMMPLATRRALLQGVMRKAIARAPGCGVELTSAETRAVVESIPSTSIWKPGREGNVIYPFPPPSPSPSELRSVHHRNRIGFVAGLSAAADDEVDALAVLGHHPRLPPHVEPAEAGSLRICSQESHRSGESKAATQGGQAAAKGV